MAEHSGCGLDRSRWVGPCAGASSRRTPPSTPASGSPTIHALIRRRTARLPRAEWPAGKLPPPTRHPLAEVRRRSRVDSTNPKARHVSSDRTAMRGQVCPARPCSRPADTTHPYIVLSRLKRTRTRTRCDSTRLPFASLGDTDDVVTPTFCPNPTNGECLDLRADRKQLGPFDRRRHGNWRPLLRDRMPTGTYRDDQSAYEADEPSHVHL